MSSKIKPSKIIYVAGWPKDVAPSFDYLKSLKVTERFTGRGNLYKNGSVWDYKGHLERGDFEAIGKIFCSDQFHELDGEEEKFLERLRDALDGGPPLTNSWYETKTITPPPKRIPRKNFFGKLFGLYDYVEQKPYEKRTAHVSDIEVQASNNLFDELEKIVGKYGLPESAVSAQSLVLKEAEESGEYSQIGEYLTFIKSNHHDVTIFLNTIPKGTIKFISDRKSKNLYRGCYSSEYWPTNIEINFGGKLITTKRNMYCRSQENVTLWELDETIRKKILHEKDSNKFIRDC
jgi:hypothetical protein